MEKKELEAIMRKEASRRNRIERLLTFIITSLIVFINQIGLYYAYIIFLRDEKAKAARSPDFLR